MNLFHFPLNLRAFSLSSKRPDFISNARSEATHRQYAASWNDFEVGTQRTACVLCLQIRPRLPFHRGQIESGASTLAGRLAAVNYMHRMHGYPDSPASRRHVVVRETLKGVLRAIGATRQQHGKDPLLSGDIRRILAVCPNSPSGLRTVVFCKFCLEAHSADPSRGSRNR